MLSKETWAARHKENYHPELNEVINRIQNDIYNSNSLFKEWEELLNIELSVFEKVVLEIGSGGGWYLAQCIKQGASFVVGLEISNNIIDKAKEAFEHFKIKNYKFYEIPNIDSDYFSIVEEKVDIIFEITVFQHIAKSITKDYLKNANSILKEDGYLLCQFYIDDINPIDDFTNMIVRHSTKELYELFEECNLYVDKYNNLEGTPWRIYLLKYK